MDRKQLREFELIFFLDNPEKKFTLRSLRTNDTFEAKLTHNENSVEVIGHLMQKGMDMKVNNIEPFSILVSKSH